MTVTRLHCRSCDTAIEGQFAIGRFERLSPDQLAFVETFIHCEGKINRMEEVLKLSYPTIRARLRDVIRALGHELGPSEETSSLSDESRRKILDDLDQGRITSEQAVQLLRRQGHSG
ncbi:MAG: DUF2089 domain-containing protein [Chloroflexi bacterium]|nr:DUF2089 domain-containing protein [Chloroflexota bacterium]